MGAYHPPGEGACTFFFSGSFPAMDPQSWPRPSVEHWAACLACFEMPSSHLLRVLKHGRGCLRDIPAVALPSTHDFCLKPLRRTGGHQRQSQTGCSGPVWPLEAGAWVLVTTALISQLLGVDMICLEALCVTECSPGWGRIWLSPRG